MLFHIHVVHYNEVTDFSDYFERYRKSVKHSRNDLLDN